MGSGVFWVIQSINSHTGSTTTQKTSGNKPLEILFESLLSTKTNMVKINGLSAGFFSKAAATEVTISDHDGVWLTLRDISFDWQKSPLLSAELVINDLNIGDIILTRFPIDNAPQNDPAMPLFSLPTTLPTLPINISAKNISLTHLTLAPAVLGQEVNATASASVTFLKDDGKIHLEVKRVDNAPQSQVFLDASFDGKAQLLSINILAAEAKNGVVSTFLELPAAPPLQLSAQGKGKLDNFNLDFALLIDEKEQFSGELHLNKTTDNGLRFETNMGGDIAPLFLAEHTNFFGDYILFETSGEWTSDNQLEFDEVYLASRSVTLSAQASLAKDYTPKFIKLSAKMQDPDNLRITLPTQENISLESANVEINYDSLQADTWSIQAHLSNFIDSTQASFSQLSVEGIGQVVNMSTTPFIQGNIKVETKSLEFANPKIQDAVNGDGLLTSHFEWASEVNEIKLNDLTLTTTKSKLSASGKINGIDKNLSLSGNIKLVAQDLKPFSALAGRELGGAGTIELAGSGKPFKQMFDLNLSVLGQNITLADSNIDALFKGDSLLFLDAKRDIDDIEITRFDLSSSTVTAQANGIISDKNGRLDLSFETTDISTFKDGINGTVIGTLKISGPIHTGKGLIFAKLRSKKVAIQHNPAGSLLNGDSDINIDVTLDNQLININALNIENPQLTLAANGQLSENGAGVKLTGKITNLQDLLPPFPGEATINGTINGSPLQGYQLDINGMGPGGINAKLFGTIDGDFENANLHLTGSAQAGLANPFLGARGISGPLTLKLRLEGPLDANSVAGSVAISGGEFVDPLLPFNLNNINGIVTISDSKMHIDIQSDGTAGGSIETLGTLELNAPYIADITVQSNEMHLKNINLYESIIAGKVTIAGPLAGKAKISGKIDVGETQIRLETTFDTGNADIWEIKYINDNAAQKATRDRAGFLEDSTQKGKKTSKNNDYLVDLTISAPRKIFIRGHGLDAELGGTLVLSGTTNNIIPIGKFDLIRGRYDILGRRLALSSASLGLEGDFNPIVSITATTQADGVTASVTISGDASNPKVSFSSSPPLPQEEILSRILFSQRLDRLSPGQAIQLISAISALRGNKNAGIGQLGSRFGLDDLDIDENAAGETRITFGRYLTDNIYSKAIITPSGGSEVQLNLDLSQKTSLKGQVQDNGSVGMGIFFQTDY